MNSKLISVFLNFCMFIGIFGSPLLGEEYGPNISMPYNHTTPPTNHTPTPSINCCNNEQISIIVVSIFVLVGFGWMLSCCCRRKRRISYDAL